MEGERQGGKVRGSRELEDVGRGGRNARMMGRKERAKREKSQGWKSEWEKRMQNEGEGKYVRD